MRSRIFGSAVAGLLASTAWAQTAPGDGGFAPRELPGIEGPGAVIPQLEGLERMTPPRRTREIEIEIVPGQTIRIDDPLGERPGDDGYDLGQAPNVSPTTDATTNLVREAERRRLVSEAARYRAILDSDDVRLPPASATIADGFDRPEAFADIAAALRARSDGEDLTIDYTDLTEDRIEAERERLARLYGLDEDLLEAITLTPFTEGGERVFIVRLFDDESIMSQGPGVIPVVDDRTPAEVGGRSRGPAAIGPDVLTACDGVPCFEQTVALHDDGATNCSGVYLGEGWILTAAHCACQPSLLAAVGDTVWNPFFESSLEREVFGFEETPENAIGDFCQAEAGGRSPERDIALLRASSDLIYLGEEPRAAVLSSALYERIRYVHIAGFGANNSTNAGGRKTTFRRDLDREACARRGEAAVCQPEWEFAVPDMRQADTCNGDSGGPVMAPVSDGQMAVVGITARALVEDNCGRGGVYTLVADDRVIAWLRSHFEDLDVIEEAEFLLADVLVGGEVDQ